MWNQWKHFHMEKVSVFLPRNFAANVVKNAALAQARLPASTYHSFCFLSSKISSFSKNGFHFIAKEIIFQVSSRLSETTSHNSHSIWFYFRNFMSAFVKKLLQLRQRIWTKMGIKFTVCLFWLLKSFIKVQTILLDRGIHFCFQRFPPDFSPKTEIPKRN